MYDSKKQQNKNWPGFVQTDVWNSFNRACMVIYQKKRVTCETCETQLTRRSSPAAQMMHCYSLSLQENKSSCVYLKVWRLRHLVLLILNNKWPEIILTAYTHVKWSTPDSHILYVHVVAILRFSLIWNSFNRIIPVMYSHHFSPTYN